jgi:hypothetical protein
VAVLLASGTTTFTLRLGIITERCAEILTSAFTLGGAFVRLGTASIAFFASTTIVFCYSFCAFLTAASCSFTALSTAALACF